MKPLTVLAAAAGTVAVLAGCTANSGTSAAQSGTSASPAATATPSHGTASIACPKRYTTWKNGPGKEVVAAVDAVVVASRNGDIQAQQAALKKAAPAVDAATSNPMPACADPKGYWSALMLHVNAAAQSLKSGSGTDSVKVALHDVPKIDRQLNAEVKRTAAAR